SPAPGPSSPAPGPPPPGWPGTPPTGAAWRRPGWSCRGRRGPRWPRCAGRNGWRARRRSFRSRVGSTSMVAEARAGRLGSGQGDHDALVLDQDDQGVDPEPVDPPGQPEAQGVEHGLLDLGVAPVQVGLGVEEHPVVVLAGTLVPAPGAVADVAQPVARRAAAGPGVAPDVPVAPGVVPGRPRRLEPRVLVGGV